MCVGVRVLACICVCVIAVHKKTSSLSASPFNGALHHTSMKQAINS